jgi:hypothetical protein
MTPTHINVSQTLCAVIIIVTADFPTKRARNISTMKLPMALRFKGKLKHVVYSALKEHDSHT